MTIRLTPKLAALSGVALVLLVIAVGWFLLVSPQRSKASKLSSDIEASQTQLTISLAQARTLRREAHSRAAQLAALTIALPSNVQMSGILRQLSASAAAAGVRVDTVTPSPVTQGGNYIVVPLSVSVTGRYFGIMNFAHLLRERAVVNGEKVKVSGRLFKIDAIQFSAGSTDTGSSAGALSVTMTIDAFTTAATTTTAVPGTTATSAPASVPASAAGTGP